MSSPCPHVRFNHTVTTEIYTLSLHDALPIFRDIVELARQSKSNWREGNQPLRCDSHRTPRSRAKVPTHRRLSRDSVAEGAPEPLAYSAEGGADRRSRLN